MADDPIDKWRRAEKWLAALNYLVATTNLLLFPCCGFGWWFSWSMNDASDKWLKDAEVFFVFAAWGGMLMLGGALCLGFIAGKSLRQEVAWGRTLTGVLIVLAALHLLFAAVLTALLYKPGSSHSSNISAGLFLTLYLGPSLLYCVAAPMLLRMHNRFRLLDVETDAQALWLPPEHHGSQQGIIEGSQMLGTRADRPAKKARPEAGES